ncbi:hypothetical protein IQ22_00763 [Pseudomonas duriflava]|uniref:Acid shock protein n=1 Tax=Pseudomonas duriflava TaxID=459528 RepID=A0A562QNA6_9PSED|nr:hypothetical protein [Pseudomonas duriflava]TWI57546.1 hypothetical protein IQ22_00763 [Pseudomonas duriflava]
MSVMKKSVACLSITLCLGSSLALAAQAEQPAGQPDKAAHMQTQPTPANKASQKNASQSHTAHKNTQQKSTQPNSKQAATLKKDTSANSHKAAQTSKTTVQHTSQAKAKTTQNATNHGDKHAAAHSTAPVFKNTGTKPE